VKDRSNPDYDGINVSLKEVAASVGSIFIVWSQLERALRKAVSDVQLCEPKRSPHGIAQTLNLWKELNIDASQEHYAHHRFLEELNSVLSEGLEIRNRLAHGITGWSVASGDGNDAHITTLMYDQEITIQFTELRATISQLGYIASHMDRITSFTLHPAKWKHLDLHAEIREALQRKRKE